MLYESCGLCTRGWRRWRAKVRPDARQSAVARRSSSSVASSSSSGTARPPPSLYLPASPETLAATSPTEKRRARFVWDKNKGTPPPFASAGGASGGASAGCGASPSMRRRGSSDLGESSALTPSTRPRRMVMRRPSLLRILSSNRMPEAPPAPSEARKRLRAAILVYVAQARLRTGDASDGLRSSASAFMLRMSTSGDRRQRAADTAARCANDPGREEREWVLDSARGAFDQV